MAFSRQHLQGSLCCSGTESWPALVTSLTVHPEDIASPLRSGSNELVHGCLCTLMFASSISIDIYGLLSEVLLALFSLASGCAAADAAGARASAVVIEMEVSYCAAALTTPTSTTPTF